MVSALNVPPPSSAPSATTPCPSRNRSGSAPWYATGIWLLPSVTLKLIFRSSPRTKLPAFTNPPSRMRVPDAICFSATSLGELKNTIESRNALSMSATAMASTPSPPPIRTRRRRLRVMIVFSPAALLSALQSEAFYQNADTLEIVGSVDQRALGVGGSVLGLVALTEHHIGAHQAEPAVDVGAVTVQPVGETCDHAADHVAALVVAQIGRRGDIVGARTGSGDLRSGRPRQRLAYELDPLRPGRRIGEQRAPHRGSL